jgi:peptidoglycan-associated lipoprotein
MIRVGFIRLVLLVGVLVVSLSGCGCFYQSMRGEKAPPAPSAAVTKAAPSEVKQIQAAPAPAAAAVVSAVVLKDVHFDFDKYLIRPQDAEILKQDFSWLKANPGKRVRVEGKCDERGTVEYNLALGQKRADAAKTYLVTLGADAKLLDTVSYGKERPVDPGHNEAAWAKNRRAHLEPAK